MTTGALFVGGPADGALIAFPGEEPPLTYDVATPPRTRWTEAPDSLEPVRYAKHRYIRAVNPDNEGPLWLMRYEGASVS